MSLSPPHIASLFWRPHLGAILGGIVVLALAAWIIVVFQRYRKRLGTGRTIVLLIPRVLILGLLILALFDPVFGITEEKGEKSHVLALVDVSSSMDVADRDETARVDRARKLYKTISSALSDELDFTLHEFDHEIYFPGNPPPEGRPTPRPTDIGRSLLQLSRRPEVGSHLGILMLTDGGDEQVRAARLPTAPLFIGGVGSPRTEWDDFYIKDVDYPKSVELDAEFAVDAEAILQAQYGFALNLKTAAVRFEENKNGSWTEIDSKEFDISEDRRFPLTFTAPSSPSEGIRHFRIIADPVPRELTQLNNVREFKVNTEKRNLYVLMFTRSLGWEPNISKRTIDRDPGIALTALSRVAGERFIVQGDRQENDVGLEAGFPSDIDLLRLYKCVVLGSFPASDLSQTQFAVLKQYVAEGGSVIFLGGDESFGHGGFATTPIAPIYPWVLDPDEPEIAIGEYPVILPPSSAEGDVIRGYGDAMSKVGTPLIWSVNPVGPLKTGAVSMLDTSLQGRTVPVVAMMPYGEGLVLGMATNTLWKWKKRGGLLEDAYVSLFLNGIRHLAGMDEGGQFMSVRWDQPSYRPSEEAEVTVGVAGKFSEGELDLECRVTFEGRTTALDEQPVSGRKSTFKVKIPFDERGEYLFEIDAFAGTERIETYSKLILVSPTRNEGAELEVNHAFLESLARRSGGDYANEIEADNLVESIRSRIQREMVTTDVPIVSGLGIYPALFILLLVAEWILRRRLNLL